MNKLNGVMSFFTENKVANGVQRSLAGIIFFFFKESSIFKLKDNWV